MTTDAIATLGTPCAVVRALREGKITLAVAYRTQAWRTHCCGAYETLDGQPFCFGLDELRHELLRSVMEGTLITLGQAIEILEERYGSDSKPRAA